MEHYGLDSRIDVNPALRHSTSPAPDDHGEPELPFEAAEFDPFLPADMQSAHYIPEDALQQAAEPEEEPEPEPEPASQDAEATVLFSHATVPSGSRVCLYDYETDRRYPLKGMLVSLGRGTANDIRVNDPGMSRRHAELLWNGELWMVRDCGSTNGTYLNGEPVTQHILIDGDVIECGTTRLEFREG